MQALNAVGRVEEAGELYVAAEMVKRAWEVAFLRGVWEMGRMGREGVRVGEV